MLRDAGVRADILPSHVDEGAIKQSMQKANQPVEDIAMALAIAKARVISEGIPGAMVIGADQILVCDGQLFDKPNNMQAAAGHLAVLSGKEHQLVTAACVLCDGVVQWQHLSAPRLTMRPVDDGYIASYLADVGEIALTSVGAYQLEGLGAQLFDRVDGDFFAILGLPLLPLLAFLRSEGLA